jgi:hypothetical protein
VQRVPPAELTTGARRSRRHAPNEHCLPPAASRPAFRRAGYSTLNVSHTLVKAVRAAVFVMAARMR